VWKCKVGIPFERESLIQGGSRRKFPFFKKNPPLVFTYIQEGEILFREERRGMTHGFLTLSSESALDRGMIEETEIREKFAAGIGRHPLYSCYLLLNSPQSIPSSKWKMLKNLFKKRLFITSNTHTSPPPYFFPSHVRATPS